MLYSTWYAPIFLWPTNTGVVVCKLTDLGSANTCSSVLEVYGAVGIGGTGFGMDLYGPVLFYVLSKTRIE